MTSRGLRMDRTQVLLMTPLTAAAWLVTTVHETITGLLPGRVEVVTNQDMPAGCMTVQA